MRIDSAHVTGISESSSTNLNSADCVLVNKKRVDMDQNWLRPLVHGYPEITVEEIKLRLPSMIILIFYCYIVHVFLWKSLPLKITWASYTLLG